MTKSLIGIYDFELLPYALGDVLTWNVKTAIQCEEAGREALDVYVSVDRQSVPFIFQRELVDQHNAELFFHELYAAFCTNPKLRNIYIFRSKDSLIERLQEVAAEDDINALRVAKYLATLEQSGLTHGVDPAVLSAGASPAVPGSEALVAYFTSEILSHKSINAFARKYGRIPQLVAPSGCAADVEQFMQECGAGKRIVPFHFRCRQLDLGYGGEGSYPRDANFVEWFDFLERAAKEHPEVIFVAVGRLQEKPLAMLQLPNVTNLRVLGMNLGHELALLLQGEFFIGISSGFAQFANFTSVPYFVVKMTQESYRAYDIPLGSAKLPFALGNQELISGPDTSALLFSLLERGLSRNADRARNLREPRFGAPVIANERTRLSSSHISTTTSRFFINDDYQSRESSRLLLGSIQEGKENWLKGELLEASRIIKAISDRFPDLCWTSPQYLLVAGGLAIENANQADMQYCFSQVKTMTKGKKEVPELLQLIQILLGLAIEYGSSSSDFASRFGQLRAGLKYTNLRLPLAPAQLLPEMYLGLRGGQLARRFRRYLGRPWREAEER
jgi:hypothetical protein